MTKKIQFNNIKELQNQVNQLPEAEYRTLHTGEKIVKQPEKYELETPETTPTEMINQRSIDKNVAIVNKKTQSVASITSNKYDLVQHRDAFNPVLEALRELKVDIKGTLFSVDSGNRVFVKAVMPEEQFVIEDDSAYNTGFYFNNSYDRSSGIHLSAYYMRMVCQNGMYSLNGNIVPTLRRKHIGNVDLVKRYKDWFKDLLKSSSKLRDRLRLIDGQKLYVDYSLDELGIAERWKDRIKDEVELDGGMANRKSVYDALTKIITHDMEDVSQNTVEKYQSKAEKLLYEDLNILVGVDRGVVEA